LDMRIGFIGTGRVGTTMCFLLKKNNTVIGVYDLDKGHERRAVRLLRLKENPSLEDLCRASEAILFATPDDQILPAYKKARPFIRGRKYLFHFSGALPADIFPKQKSVYRCSVHPFATFPRLIIPPRRKKYLIFIQGETPAKKAAARIFSRKYFKLENISPAQKPYYHLVGVFGSNLVVGLGMAIYGLVKKMGWRKKDFYEKILPLVRETLHNIRSYGLGDALSGPLQRGDIRIMKQHLRSLRGDKILFNIYKILSQEIMENLPRKKGYDNIKRMLRL
jgi:predicted short-subunit dehydrogenase-like oxidoreductase (DUF2520 family)